jgi:hypothetical protein
MFYKIRDVVFPGYFCIALQKKIAKKVSKD